jgi:hypothetical protein
MKPESQRAKNITGELQDETTEWDPYLVAIVNGCQDAAGIMRSENISVVVDEMDSTAIRRRTALLRSAGRP